MKTRFTTLTCMFTLFAALAAAQAPEAAGKPDENAAKAAKAAQAREAILRKTGGVVISPAKGPALLLADLRGGADDPVLARAVTELSRLVMLPFRSEKRKPGATLWQSAREALSVADTACVVLVMDGDDLPTLLVAPESRWAVLNVKPLKQGVDQAAAERRIQQEIWRAVAYVLGVADSSSGKCAMSAVLAVEDLDKLGPHVNPEYINRMKIKAAVYGMQPVRPVPYRKAVEEGWAQPPKTRYEQAVWDEVQAARK